MDIFRSKRFWGIDALLLLVCLALLGCGQNQSPMKTLNAASKYKAGQVWSYKTRSQEPNSTFTIVKVEGNDKLGPIVHISLKGLKIKNPAHPSGFSDTVSHMPLAEKAVDLSVIKLVKEGAALPDYQEGYNQWKAAFDAGQGGIFTTSVAQAVDFIAQAIEKPKK